MTCNNAYYWGDKQKQVLLRVLTMLNLLLTEAIVDATSVI